ncbi:MAG TPA: Xaa-Pro peptidase family protein [Gaiellaceae bacterium]|nr:Xaa-Pro peptidase family protein [Gaiellaceae bacterium]
MKERLARVQEQLEQPLLVTNPVNVKYLVGFDSSNCALLVERDRVRLFTDFRYIQGARAIDGVEPVETERDTIRALGELLGGRKVSFEGLLPYALYERLRSAGVELSVAEPVVERLRAVKDEQELETLRRACAITDRAYERLAEVQFTGRTERDVSWELEQIFREEGADGVAFEFIVGAGPTGSSPHARAGDRVIGPAELVVVDAGCTVDGYASDYTRTFATGGADGELREAYDVVLAAQQAALDGIRAGLTGVEADALARSVIEGSAFAGTFGHGLGHGLGLDVHEAPRLSTESPDTLVPGNVVTVEPGVYLEGRFGVRIEDDVVVTADGIENLTGFTKEWVEVP